MAFSDVIGLHTVNGVIRGFQFTPRATFHVLAVAVRIRVTAQEQWHTTKSQWHTGTVPHPCFRQELGTQAVPNEWNGRTGLADRSRVMIHHTGVHRKRGWSAGA